MITEKEFKKKVKAMTAKEIIMTMVEGLKNPITIVDMSTYLKIDGNICYGCAATNTICKIAKITRNDILKADIKNNDGSMSLLYRKSNYLGSFVERFESAINYLRLDLIGEYNDIARELGIDLIIDCCFLPILKNNYTSLDLQCYIELANGQK